MFGRAGEQVSDARLALERWSALERACEHRRSERERRFRKRAYERARDSALVALALQPGQRSAAPELARPRGGRGLTAAA